MIGRNLDSAYSMGRMGARPFYFLCVTPSADYAAEWLASKPLPPDRFVTYGPDLAHPFKVALERALARKREVR